MEKEELSDVGRCLRRMWSQEVCYIPPGNPPGGAIPGGGNGGAPIMPGGGIPGAKGARNKRLSILFISHIEAYTYGAAYHQKVEA